MGQGHSISGGKPPEKTDNQADDNRDAAKSVESDLPIAGNGPYTAPYDALDKLQEQLPSLIDDESLQQVEDYKQACDNGKGPMVACFATGEYVGMFERKVDRKSVV